MPGYRNYNNCPKKVSRLYAEDQGRPDARGPSRRKVKVLTDNRVKVRQRAGAAAQALSANAAKAMKRKELARTAKSLGVKRTWTKSKRTLTRMLQK